MGEIKKNLIMGFVILLSMTIMFGCSSKDEQQVPETNAQDMTGLSNVMAGGGIVWNI